MAQNQRKKGVIVLCVRSYLLALKRLNQYLYKLVSTYYVMRISRFGMMENDNKNRSSAWHLAICLLEKNLTRANRAQKYELKK
jgi:hypothetical protein